MDCALNGHRGPFVLGLCILFLLAGIANAADPHEPLPSGEFRELRDGYVTTWYVYNDNNQMNGGFNGILDPGDTLLETIDNWWTPVSAHTQHNYGMRDVPAGMDYTSAPMNFATSTLPDAHPNKNDPTWNFWLEPIDNAISFYLTYSQYDNNDFIGTGASAYDQQHNGYKNGWAMGWVTDVNIKVSGEFIEYNPLVNKEGEVLMDIFVHNGEMTFAGIQNEQQQDIGASRSNPQVSLSNDISEKALQPGGQLQPPDYQDAAGVEQGYVFTGLNDLRWAGDEPTFNEIRDSMEVFEVDADGLAANQVVVGDDTPNAVANDANRTDGHGNSYVYEDAFLTRDSYATYQSGSYKDGATYTTGSTDGGVVAGLSGYDEYDPGQWDTTWGDQQVIRIDLDASVFEAYNSGTNADGGDIEKIIIWDFGFLPGATQVTPVMLELDLNDLFMTDTGQYRFYIARVDMAVPEPGTMVLLACGGAGMLLRRRRRSK